MRTKKIVFSVILQDAGEATRAIEIANGMRDFAPEHCSLDIYFLSYGSPFEQRVLDNGYKIFKCSPTLPGIGFHHDLQTTSSNIIGNEELVKNILDGQINALNELNPDFLLYGFWPIAGLARKMTTKRIMGISYLPIPFLREMYSTTLMKDIPDMLKPLTYLPRSLRKAIFSIIPKALKLKAPLLKQTTILSVLESYKIDFKVNDIFDMLHADFTIINDFKEFYNKAILPDNVEVVGPLYAPAKNESEIDENIIDLYSKAKNKLKLFCSLGSSGKKEYLFEVIKAVKANPDWNAVILSPKAVCPLKEAQELANNCSNIYLTDKFVPSPLINKLADIVVSHGGQGTVQTAIASGTPIVGYAMQPEQQINLDNVVMRGAGIRIPIHRWNAKNIQKSIRKIINDSDYKINIEKLQTIINQTNGKKLAAQTIWKFMEENNNVTS